MPSAKTTATMLRITLVRSPIATPRSHRIRLKSLGLRRIRHSVLRPDTRQVQGLIQKLTYLVKVEKANP